MLFEFNVLAFIVAIVQFSVCGSDGTLANSIKCFWNYWSQFSQGYEFIFKKVVNCCALSCKLLCNYPICLAYFLPWSIDSIQCMATHGTSESCGVGCLMNKAFLWALNILICSFLADVKVAVKNKVPLVRSLTLSWVTFCIETSNKAAILKVHKEYVPICMEVSYLHVFQIHSFILVLILLNELLLLSWLILNQNTIENLIVFVEHWWKTSILTKKQARH